MANKREQPSLWRVIAVGFFFTGIGALMLCRELGKDDPDPAKFVLIVLYLISIAFFPILFWRNQELAKTSRKPTGEEATGEGGTQVGSREEIGRGFKRKRGSIWPLLLVSGFLAGYGAFTVWKELRKDEPRIAGLCWAGVAFLAAALVPILGRKEPKDWSKPKPPDEEDAILD